MRLITARSKSCDLERGPEPEISIHHKAYSPPSKNETGPYLRPWASGRWSLQGQRRLFGDLLVISCPHLQSRIDKLALEVAGTAPNRYGAGVGDQAATTRSA